jgi:hypothetical protein
MEADKLVEYVDQQRWLLNNGLVPDSIKNQLFFCGSIVHKDVQAVEVSINPEEKIVDYIIYVKKDVIKKIAKCNKLSTATSLFGMWRFKRFLQKEGSLNFQAILNGFVADFCGPKWSTKVTVSDFDVYVDNIGVEGEAAGSGQQSNKLPD